jgi:hypothetical protein
METLFIIYHESFEPEVSAIIERHMVVSRYTRIDNVIGARMAEREEDTGVRAERRNRVILLVAEPGTITGMLADLKSLREREGHGLRAFVVPVSRVI